MNVEGEEMRRRLQDEEQARRRALDEEEAQRKQKLLEEEVSDWLESCWRWSIDWNDK